MSSQCQLILAALQQGEWITPLDALKRWGCFRLGARVWDLKQAGIPVSAQTIRQGRKKFACYSLKLEHRNLKPDFECRRVSLPSEPKIKVIARNLPPRSLDGKFDGKQTVNDDKAALKLYKQGKTYREIGKILGFPWTTIYKRLRPLRDAGVFKSRPSGQQARQLNFNDLGKD